VVTARAILGLLCALPLVACSDRVPVCRDDSPQHAARPDDDNMLQSELQSKGLKTDTCSLVNAVWSNQDQEIRWNAVLMLECTQNSAARQALSRAMKKDQSDLVRKIATEVLARCGDPEGKKRLTALIAKSDQVSDQAAMASQLAAGGDPSAYGYAARVARSEKAYQRVQATAVLYPFFRYRLDQLPVSQTQPGPDELLRSLLTDPDANVRRTAVDLTNQVVGMRDRALDDYAPLLEKMAKSDSDEEIRKRCKLYLGAWHIEQKKR
jgi:HEAT repeat protein